jgi:hypothetical protein
MGRGDFEEDRSTGRYKPVLSEMNPPWLRCQDFDQPVAESEPHGRIGFFSQCLLDDLSHESGVPCRFLLGIDHTHDGTKLRVTRKRLFQSFVDQFVVNPEGKSIGHWIFREALRKSW